VLMQEQQEKEPADALPQGTPLEVEAASLAVLVLGEAALMVVASCLLLMVEEAELGDADQLSHSEAWVLRPTSGTPRAASSALTPERQCSPDRQPHQ